MVVLIRPDVKLPAISLLGNNCLANFMKWSATENDRFGSATNCSNVTSAVNTLVDRSVVFEVAKKDFICGCVFVAFFKVPRLAGFEWRTTSYLPPNDTFTCTLHTLQYANIGPLSLAHTKSIRIAHSGWYFAAYFLFFAELAHGQSDARFAILSSFQRNDQRIIRLITLDLRWQVKTRLFTKTMCKKYVVITLQAQAIYRKRQIKINLDFCSLDFVEVVGDRVSRAGVQEIWCDCGSLPLNAEDLTCMSESDMRQLLKHLSNAFYVVKHITIWIMKG